jgi:transcription antitermination protein NusB
MSRRQARELALQILFQKEFMPTANPNELFDLFQDHLALEKTLVGYSKDLVSQVLQKQKEIDDVIQKYNLNWNIKRLSLIDLNILRIAVCEMLFMPQDPTPPKAVTDEAIEIAKKYSSLEAPAFINGILDQILHKELKYE